MNKKEKNLLFLLLACSILFVGILYSPIGSPDSYVQTSYYLQNQGVNFSGKIQNASKMSNFGINKSSPSFKSQNNFSGDNSFSSSPTISLENKSIEVAEPEYNSDKKNAPKYAVSNASKYTNSSSSITNTTYSVQSKTNNIISNQNNSGGSVGGGMDNAGTAIVGKTTDDNNSNAQPNGFIALNNIDLSIFGDLSSKQGVGYTPGSGATDPGEDPIGEPIPVPDGFWVLLLMAVGYTATKYFKKKPQTI